MLLYEIQMYQGVSYCLFKVGDFILKWYVLRTIVGKEEKAIFLLQHLFHDIKIIFPRRKLSWRKKGKIIDVIKPLFSGYLFVSANDKQIMELNLWLRTHRIDLWFVKLGNLITPITTGEIKLIQKLMCNSEIVEGSEILKIGDKVMIVKGPLVGLEGIIEKYSKRNRRVIIKVTIGGEEKQVELKGIWINSRS